MTRSDTALAAIRCAVMDCSSSRVSSEITEPGTETNLIFRMVTEDVAIKCAARIVGEVDYREGEGVLHMIPMGKVEIEATSDDITLTWFEGSFHGVAAMPFANFCWYVSAGAIEL
jgi:hypothetical protein